MGQVLLRDKHLSKLLLHVLDEDCPQCCQS
jgi:hypothetical protein